MQRSTAVPIIAFSIAGFLVLAIGNITSTSATSDEVPHLAAGWSYWKLHDFRMNTEHPPLLKLLAAVPLQFMNVWPQRFRADGSAEFAAVAEVWPATRDTVWAQWLFAHRVIYAMRDGVFLNDSRAMFLRARLLMLAISGLGLAAVIVCWSYEMWGWGGAALSTVFFCFDPNFIAHAGLVTTDVGASFLICGAVYFLWRCSKRFSAFNVIGFALFVALSQVAKFSAIVLLPVTAVLLLIVTRRASRLLVLIGSAAVATIVVIWASYGFRFDATHGELPLRSLISESQKNDRFSGALLFANDHQLLPQPYLYGWARLRSGESRDTYLMGRKLPAGVRSYFFWTFITKTPVATIVAILSALIVAFRRRRLDLLFLLVPAAIYFAFAVSSDLNLGHRHILPVYPFLYVLCGILPLRFLAAAVLALISCFVVFTPFDTMWGRHLSYFNELARGPRHGYEILADSNIDWGQDLPRLHRWLRIHNVREPVDLVWTGSADPRAYNIRFRNLEGGYWAIPEIPAQQIRDPGWLVISVNAYSGAFSPHVDDWSNFIAAREGRLAGRAGYSILIFRIAAPKR